MMTMIDVRRWLPAVVLLVLVACAEDSLVLPDQGQPDGLQVFGGNDQEGVAGTPLSDSIVVRVTDSKQRPVQDVPVIFTVTDGGQVIPDTALTDADGRASSRWILGPTAGSQTLVAKVAGEPGPGITFTATADPGEADSLTAVAGNDQTGQAGTALKDSLVVQVTDAMGNGIPDVPVSWSANQGSLSEAAPVTDGSGRVAAAWTLGSQVGTQSVQVTSAGLSGSPATFTATATSGPPPQLALSTQPGTTATSGIPLGPQPVVQLQDASGAPVQQGGVLVTAGITSGGGTLLGNTSVNTNSGGQAAFTDLAIAGSPGDRTLTFGASGHISVTSNPITVTAGTPDLGASSLSAAPTTILASNGSATATLTVVARDDQDNVVAGVAVSFSVTGGGVTVTQPAGPTNSSGVATGTLSSTAAGPKTVSAALNGAGIGQTVVVTVAPSNASARHSTATVPDGSMGNPTVIDIQLRDQFSNPLKAGGDNVVVTVTGANSVSASVTDNDDGSYTATYTPAASGTDDIAISVNGNALGGSPFQSDVTSPVSATQSTVSVSPGSITASSGSANAAITVTARDGSGSPVAGVSVNVSATGSGNSLTQPSGPTNSQGVATATLSSTAAEVKTISASVAGISLNQTASVTVQAGPPSPQTTQVSTPGGRRGQIIPITITTHDQFDNPLTVGGYGAQISVRVTGTNAWGNLNVNDLGDGTYSAGYLALFKGNDDVEVLINGVPVQGSPFRSQVK